MQHLVVTASLQVDYEATKHELRHIREELNETTSEVEAMDRLKTIAEQNLTEALNMLQQERELRHNIKKELDQRIASESMFGLHNLSLLSLRDARPDAHQTPSGGAAVTNSESGLHLHHVDDGDVQNPALKRIEADFSSPKHELLRPAPAPSQGLVGDLFSEVHVGEIRKLERMLEQTEIEKSNLERALEESTTRLAEAVSEVATRTADVSTLKAQLEQMSANQKTPSEIPGADPEIMSKFPNYQLAVVELSTLTKDLETLRLQQQSQLISANPDDRERLDAEIVCYYRDMINKLEVQFADQCQVADELRTGFGQTKDGLQQICSNLAQFYGSICEQAGELPDKALMSNVAEGSSYADQSSLQSICDRTTSQDDAGNSASESELSKNSSGYGDCTDAADGPPAVVCYRLIEMAQKQIQCVGCVFDRLIEKSRGPYHTDVTANMDEVTELQEQV